MGHYFDVAQNRFRKSSILKIQVSPLAGSSKNQSAPIRPVNSVKILKTKSGKHHKRFSLLCFNFYRILNTLIFWNKIQRPELSHSSCVTALSKTTKLLSSLMVQYQGFINRIPRYNRNLHRVNF